MGAIFRIKNYTTENNEEVYDKTRTDYENIFREGLLISPDLNFIINYLKKIKPPKHKEWHLLIPQAQNGNIYARNRFFEMYLRVVYKISLKYHKASNYELDDIFQVGSMGLLQAIYSYDFSKHGSFVSYMPLWISLYIQRAIDELSRPIRIPVYMQVKIKNVKKTLNALKSRSLKKPTIQEIANVCKLSEESIRDILKYSTKTLSIENFLKKDRTGYCIYNDELKNRHSFENAIESEELRRVLIELLDMLSEKESRIICLRLGFYDNRPKTLEEVGILLGVTRERIRQIETKAMKKLALPSNSKKLDGYCDIWKKPIVVSENPP